MKISKRESYTNHQTKEWFSKEYEIVMTSMTKLQTTLVATTRRLKAMGITSTNNDTMIIGLVCYAEIPGRR